MHIPGYRLGEVRCTETRHIIYEAVRTHDAQPVLIKAVRDLHADPSLPARLQREYETMRALAGTAIVPACALVRYDEGAVLAMENAGRPFLHECLEGEPFDLHRALSVALGLTTVLGALHDRRYVHNAVTPRHLLVDPATSAVWLIGFDSASQHPGEDVPFDLPGLQDPAYLSPEQTGRMNRRVDYRSDYYALGVILYEMLTGRRPFDARDPLEWVHARLARPPTPPDALRPDVPAAVSGLVLKLLAKTAEERYQNAPALRADLENARLYEDRRREGIERERTEATLRAIIAGTAAVTGTDYFHSLVRHLADAYHVRYAFVTECANPEHTRARTLAFLKDGSFADTVEYDLTGTPCEGVIAGEVCYYPDGVEARFPREAGMASYLGVPIVDAEGRILGHLAIMDGTPRRFEPKDTAILQIFAARAGAELERQRAEAALKRAHDDLERRIAERTAELLQTNTRLQQEISERERMEAAVRASEKAYRDFYLEAPNVYISIGINGLIERANRRAAELFGYDLDALLGKPIFSLVADTEVGKPRARKVFERFLAGRETLGEEMEFVRADGSHFWGAVSVKPYCNEHGEIVATRSIIVDISKRIKAEEALQHRLEIEDLVAQISNNFINLAPDAVDEEVMGALARIGRFVRSDRSYIYLLSEDGQTARCSHRWCADHVGPDRIPAFVWTRAHAPWFFQTLEENQVLHIAHVTDLPAAAGGFKDQLEADGIQAAMYVPMLMGKHPFGCIGFDSIHPDHPWSDEDIRLLRIVGECIVNALERKRIQIQLHAAKEAAEAANRAKSEFLANMSHELRTPLNGILGFAQILKRDPRLTPPQRAGVDVIERSGEHLLTLINDILDLSKIEAGKLETQVVEFHLPEFLKNVADIARVRAEQRGLAFLYEPLTPLPVTVRGDERRLRQVLLNLLGNAVKFTEQGGVAFRVQVAPSNRPAGLRFEVEDTGIGIEANQLDEIFQPFKQMHGPDRPVEGTGLGLAISRKLIRLMQGTIQVTSTPGRGSLFSVEVDLPAVASSAIRATTDRRIVGYEGPPRTILAVDDKPENQAVLVDLLAPLGFRVEVAGDGREALDKARTLVPDLILMDLVLPVLDGFEATRRIRRMPALRHTVIIALSASVFEHSRRHSREAGCNDFVPKPIHARLLFDSLSEHLGLTWIYEKAPPEPAPGAAPGDGTSTELPADPGPLTLTVPPPPTEAARLHTLSLTGDIHGIREQIDRIAGLGSVHRPLVERLRRMADDYDMQGISDFLSPYLTDSHERDAD